MTPSTKNLSSLKKVGEKSSRKAFGNVSNVLRANSQASNSGKSVTKAKLAVKTSEELESVVKAEEKKALAVKAAEVAAKSTEQTQTESKVETETKVEPKYLDEIENMYPIEEELMSDLRDPMTAGLFSIDDRLATEMTFDLDFCEELLPNKKDFDFDKLF